MKQIEPGRNADGTFAKGNDQRLESNGNWKGDAASKDAARDRIKRVLPLGECEACGMDATDRHHKDGNAHNNDLSNISMLCRRCHMTADGRLDRLREMNKSPEYRWARQKGGSK